MSQTRSSFQDKGKNIHRRNQSVVTFVLYSFNIGLDSERVLAMISAGFVIPALMKPKDQQKSTKGCRAAWLEAPSGSFSCLSQSRPSRCMKFRIRVSGCSWTQTVRWILTKLLGHFLSLWRCRFKNMKGKSVKKGRDWILEKKERRRRQGRYEHYFASSELLLKCSCFKMRNRSFVLCNTRLLSLCDVCVLWPAGRFEPTQSIPDVREDLISSRDSCSWALVSSRLYHHTHKHLWNLWVFGLGFIYSSSFHMDEMKEYNALRASCIPVWLFVCN